MKFGLKFYKLEVTTLDNKKHLEFTSAKNELDAIDKVAKYYKKEIIDIKVV